MPDLLLESARLNLRPVHDEDLDDLHQCFVHPEVRRYLLDDEIIGVDQVAGLIGQSERSFQREGYGFYGLRLRESDFHDRQGLIGFCGCRPADFADGLELLFGLYPEYWGKGLGSEAARKVLGHLFENTDIEQIYATTDTPNQRSVRVLQRLGMCFDRRCELRGLDTVFYSMSRQDYLYHLGARRRISNA